MFDKTLPDWVRVDKWFDRMKNEIQNVKNKTKFVVSGGSGDRINANNSYQLIQDIEKCEIAHKEALKEILKILNDIEKLKGLEEMNQDQVDMLNILFMTDEIFTGIKISITNTYCLEQKLMRKNQA